jgi:cobalt-precorrin-5B (C1)-methyltransferase
MSIKDQNNPYFQDDEMLSAEQDLPAEIKEKKKTGTLKTGYTTGTTATAATKAALYAILHGKTVDSVTVILPKGQTAKIKVAWTKIGQGTCTATCIKYGGDDPDVTHGAEICSTVSLTANPGVIEIDGGIGVGRVTKPGLGLQIGSAAINPVPRKMLEQAVREVASEWLKASGVNVIISVPKGEEIAKKTDNPRLGILGGISILGTTGIVLPYSTASFAASIRQSLDVAIAMGSDTVVLTTGGRSEDFARELFSTLPDHCFVQMGDFAGYSIKQCAAKKICKSIIAAFIGKLTKMAMGVKQTHVAGSHVDMEFMASLALQCGADERIVEQIRHANTARHVSEIVTKYGIQGFFDLVCKKVYEQMREYANKEVEIEVIMFEFDGSVIGRYPT